MVLTKISQCGLPLRGFAAKILMLLKSLSKKEFLIPLFLECEPRHHDISKTCSGILLAFEGKQYEAKTRKPFYLNPG